jgi:non-ribosomal peptide synthetase component E (peptide arylation enzyme)
MGDPQPAPLLTLLKPSTVAAYTAAGFWGDQTIYHLAVRQARATPQEFAVRDRHRRLSYPELVNAADRLAAHLPRRRRSSPDWCNTASYRRAVTA